MHFTSATILSALMAMPLASGLGINCRGSTGCTGSSQTMTKFRDAMQNIDPGWIFADGQQIICNANHICVYFQNLGFPGSKGQPAALKGLNDLVAHNCNVCGSDPTEPGNDVSKGQLTVNWVSVAQPKLGYI